MAEEKSFMEVLGEESSKVQADQQRLEVLRKELNDDSKAIEVQANSWQEKRKNLQERVKTGEISAGDPVRDYVFSNYVYHPHFGFSEEFEKDVKELKELLGKLTESGNFWYGKTEYGAGIEKVERFELFNLSKPPYVINSSKIIIQSQSSIIIRLEPILTDKAVWGFVKKEDSENQIYVGVDRAHPRYDTPLLTNNQFSKNNLESVLGKNPVALAHFRFALGKEISPELQSQVDSYVHKTALTAVGIIKGLYEDLKEYDRQIQTIEDKWNPESDNRREEFCATRPIIPDYEPDPVMAALMSSDARSNKASHLKYLARCVNDLDRIGLANYTRPIEIKVGAGEKKIFNLAEFSQYVRSILELSCKDLVKA